MKKENEITAHNIRFLRKRERLAQWELGEKYGSDQKKISFYETGKYAPATDFLINLSKATGIDPDILRTVKLKTNGEGKIINLPDKQKELQALRKELNDSVADFKQSIELFFKRIIAINSRLDTIEKKVKK